MPEKKKKNVSAKIGSDGGGGEERSEPAASISLNNKKKIEGSGRDDFKKGELQGKQRACGGNLRLQDPKKGYSRE